MTKSEFLMKYFDGNVVLGLFMMIKAQTKEKICSVNCKCCVAERTCCLCFELDCELMTCLLNKFWKTYFCYTKVQVMKDKGLWGPQKIYDDQNEDEEHCEGCKSKQ